MIGDINMEYRIITQSKTEVLDYHRMRYALWPHHTEEDLQIEMNKILKGENFYKNELSWTVFVVVKENGDLGGFAEITLYPEVCYSDSKPVAYIEGWFIDEDLRRKGIGKKLIGTAEQWAKKIGCLDIVSDVEIDNIISQNSHSALGFEKLHTEDGCILYKKKLI